MERNFPEYKAMTQWSNQYCDAFIAQNDIIQILDFTEGYYLFQFKDASLNLQNKQRIIKHEDLKAFFISLSLLH